MYCKKTPGKNITVNKNWDPFGGSLLAPASDGQNRLRRPCSAVLGAMWHPEPKPSHGQLHRTNASERMHRIPASHQGIASMGRVHASHRWAGSMGRAPGVQSMYDHSDTQSMGRKLRAETKESSQQFASTDRSDESDRWINAMHRITRSGEAIAFMLCTNEWHQ